MVHTPYHSDFVTVCWFLYLIRTADNRLYTGITTDVPRRFRQHQAGKGAKALREKERLVAGEDAFDTLLERLKDD